MPEKDSRQTTADGGPRSVVGNLKLKKSCIGCQALVFNRSLGMMDCQLGYKMFSRYPQAPQEPCPKPRRIADWVKLYVAKCKGIPKTESRSQEPGVRSQEVKKSCIELLIVLLLCSSCASGYVVSRDLRVDHQVLFALNSLFDPWRETAFCVGPHRVYNVLSGGLMSCPMPICEKADIVFHTHPIWAEKEANFIDGAAWDAYTELYGNTRYGLMTGPNEFKVYKRHK